MTPLGVLNFCALQFLCVRFTRIKIAGRTEGWGIVFPVFPFTGWWSPYVPNPPAVYLLKKIRAVSRRGF